MSLRQRVIKLALLQAVQTVGPGGGGHAVVGVQQDAEAAHNQHAEDGEEEDDKGGLLLQGHAGARHRTPRLEGGGEWLGLHQPGYLQQLVPQQTLVHPHILHMDLICTHTHTQTEWSNLCLLTKLSTPIRNVIEVHL